MIEKAFYYVQDKDSFFNIYDGNYYTHEDLDYFDELEAEHKDETRSPTFYALIDIYPNAKPAIMRALRDVLSETMAEMEFLELSGEVPEELIARKKDALMKLAYLSPDKSKRDAVYTLTPSDIARARAIPISYFIKVSKMNKAKCPFHDDKTASLHVYPKDNRFHCFGACNQGGSVIDLYIKLNNCTFKEAVHKLLA